jgi:hypothetical protein
VRYHRLKNWTNVDMIEHGIQHKYQVGAPMKVLSKWKKNLDFGLPANWLEMGNFVHGTFWHCNFSKYGESGALYPERRN